MKITTKSELGSAAGATDSLVQASPALRAGACLADVMPTLLCRMGLGKPEEMSGQSMLISDEALSSG